MEDKTKPQRSILIWDSDNGNISGGMYTGDADKSDEELRQEYYKKQAESFLSHAKRAGKGVDFYSLGGKDE